MPDSSTSLLATLRTHIHIAKIVWKWLIKLFPASIEPFLHSNFGRRYVFMPVGGCAFFLCCADLNPHPVFTSTLFFLGMVVLIIYHCIQTFLRNRLSAGEPHSSSAGDPWKIWQNLGYAKSTVQQYLEPAFCAGIGGIISRLDPFLGFWLIASAAALFIREQQSRFKINRRIQDALDAKIEAQAMNNSLKPQQPGGGPVVPKTHRAFFPKSGHHPQP